MSSTSAKTLVAYEPQTQLPIYVVTEGELDIHTRQKIGLKAIELLQKISAREILENLNNIQSKIKKKDIKTLTNIVSNGTIRPCLQKVYKFAINKIINLLGKTYDPSIPFHQFLFQNTKANQGIISLLNEISQEKTVPEPNNIESRIS